MSGQLPYKDGVLLGQGIVGRDVETAGGAGLAPGHVDVAITGADTKVSSFRLELELMMVWFRPTQRATPERD
ncbi:hypothetical protein GCM10027074_73600 [Streptomyces deserti]